MKTPQFPPLHNLLEFAEHDDPGAPLHLMFHVGEELYALSLLDVRELVRLEHLAQVPGLPPEFIGVINLRGNVVPIMDLQLRFGLAAAPPQKNSLVVICPINNTLTGLRVDAVADIGNIPEQTWLDPGHRPFSAGEKVKGVAEYQDKLVAILNLPAVIGLPKGPPA